MRHTSSGIPCTTEPSGQHTMRGTRVNRSHRVSLRGLSAYLALGFRIKFHQIPEVQGVIGSEA
jgi:hypothetical protein